MAKNTVPAETVEFLKVVNGPEAGARDRAEKPRTEVIASIAVSEAIIASDKFAQMAADFAAAAVHVEGRDVDWDHTVGANEPGDLNGLRARVWGQEIPLELPQYRIAS
ncbi:MAG: hypothetical protein JWM81_946 [Candidatus Saccharibacteria bacterium]|nr:hypothetical protein [Candidatus Saccharibacteria bacterium]